MKKEKHTRERLLLLPEPPLAPFFVIIIIIMDVGKVRKKASIDVKVFLTLRDLLELGDGEGAVSWPSSILMCVGVWVCGCVKVVVWIIVYVCMCVYVWV